MQVLDPRSWRHRCWLGPDWCGADHFAYAPSGLELKEANRIQNFSFSGITNTSQQGLAVPIAYGRVFVGSAVISSGFDVDHSAKTTTDPRLVGLPFSMRKKYGLLFEVADSAGFPL